jgi:hypothetical protein
MSPLVYRMNAVLSRGVQCVPVGTKLGLFHCLWMLLSRGAVIPGLAALRLAGVPCPTVLMSSGCKSKASGDLAK